MQKLTLPSANSTGNMTPTASNAMQPALAILADSVEASKPHNSPMWDVKDATVLVHDSTFGASESERALETGHSTAREAAEVAKAAGVGTLVLTHLSSRHSWRQLRDEARGVFKNCVVPRDLDTMVVPYPEKGEARIERV